MGETRPASSPAVGAARDAVRTLLGFIVAFGLTKIVGEQMASQMSGAVDAAIVIGVSALFAWAGKHFRNAGDGLGKII